MKKTVGKKVYDTMEMSVVKENVEFVPVERIEQVLKAALVTPPGRSGKTAKTQDAKDAAGRESAKGSGASGVC